LVILWEGGLNHFRNERQRIFSNLALWGKVVRGSEFDASAWVKRLADTLDELAQGMTATRINMPTLTVNIAPQVPAA
jgi:hypothetical protein